MALEREDRAAREDPRDAELRKARERGLVTIMPFYGTSPPPPPPAPKPAPSPAPVLSREERKAEVVWRPPPSEPAPLPRVGFVNPDHPTEINTSYIPPHLRPGAARPTQPVIGPPPPSKLPAIAPSIVPLAPTSDFKVQGGDVDLVAADALGFVKGIPSGIAGLVQRHVVAPVVERGQFTKQEFQKGYHLGAGFTSPLTGDTVAEHAAALKRIAESPAPRPEVHPLGSPLQTLGTLGTGFTAAALGVATGLTGPAGRDIGKGVGVAIAPPAPPPLPPLKQDLASRLRQLGATPVGQGGANGAADAGPKQSDRGLQEHAFALAQDLKENAKREESQGQGVGGAHVLPTPPRVLESSVGLPVERGFGAIPPPSAPLPVGGPLHPLGPSAEAAARAAEAEEIFLSIDRPDLLDAIRLEKPKAAAAGAGATAGAMSAALAVKGASTMNPIGGIGGLATKAAQIAKEHPVATTLAIGGFAAAGTAGAIGGIKAVQQRRAAPKKASKKKSASKKSTSARSSSRSTSRKSMKRVAPKSGKAARVKKGKREDRGGVSRSTYGGSKVYKDENGRHYRIRKRAKRGISKKTGKPYVLAAGTREYLKE